MARHGERYVVAGFDGSHNARAALRRAVTEAARRDARLDVVRVVTDRDLATDRPNLVLAQARADLMDAIAEEAPGLGPRDVRPYVLIGAPAKVLHRVAAAANLLVIGAREIPEDGNPLTGETLPEVLADPPCQVLVVADHAAPRPVPA